MRSYTEDDRRAAHENHLPMVGTDVEINASVRGRDVIVRVNKAGLLVCRVLLENAATDLSQTTLMNFSTFAPDFTFKVGDSAEGLARLKRAVGLA